MYLSRAPMRGAWIEIKIHAFTTPPLIVAPPCGARGLKFVLLLLLYYLVSVAPPCGARGLKYHALADKDARRCRAPMRGAWIEILINKKGGVGKTSRPHAGRVD